MSGISEVRIISEDLDFTIPVQTIGDIEGGFGNGFDVDEINRGLELAENVAKRGYHLQIPGDQRIFGDRFTVVRIFYDKSKVVSQEIGPEYYRRDIGKAGKAQVIRIHSSSTQYFAAYPYVHIVYDDVVVVLYDGQTDAAGNLLSIVLSRHQLPASSTVLNN